VFAGILAVEEDGDLELHAVRAVDRTSPIRRYDELMGEIALTAGLVAAELGITRI
jgi:hypothetical protein